MLKASVERALGTWGSRLGRSPTTPGTSHCHLPPFRSFSSLLSSVLQNTLLGSRKEGHRETHEVAFDSSWCRNCLRGHTLPLIWEGLREESPPSGLECSFTTWTYYSQERAGLILLATPPPAGPWSWGGWCSEIVRSGHYILQSQQKKEVRQEKARLKPRGR